MVSHDGVTGLEDGAEVGARVVDRVGFAERGGVERGDLGIGFFETTVLDAVRVGGVASGGFDVEYEELDHLWDRGERRLRVSPVLFAGTSAICRLMGR